MDDFLGDDGFSDGFSEGQEEGYALFGAYTDKREWASYGGESESNSTLHCCVGFFVILGALGVLCIVLGVICG